MLSIPVGLDAFPLAILFVPAGNLTVCFKVYCELQERMAVDENAAGNL